MSYSTDWKWHAGRYLTLVTAIWAVSWTLASAEAVNPVGLEIDRVTAVNRALRGVCSARLAREQWKLDKLDLLRVRGHASWREVARQRVAVETLEAHRQAADRFDEYLAVLRKRVEQIDGGHADQQPLPSTADLTPSIKLSLPGSVRLIAWLELAQMPTDIAHTYDVSLDGSTPTAAEAVSEPDGAKQQLAAAENRVRGLSRIADKPGIADELHRAKLDLAVAAAEFEWQQALRQWQQSPTRRSAWQPARSGATDQADRDIQAVMAAVAAADVTFVSHDSSPALHVATLRVAAAEAAAIGPLRAAEIMSRRSRLRCRAMQQLHDKGFASQRELDSARDAVSTAESLVDELKAQRGRLARSYKQLQTGSDGDRGHADGQYLVSSPVELTDHVSDSASNQVEPDTLPEKLFDHVSAVEHLVNLRQRRFATSAHRDAVAAEVKMLTELHCRLGSVLKREPNALASGGATDNADHSGPWTALSADRRAGGESIRRELENLRLDIEYQQALALGATERLTALRLEEVRFVRQFLEQIKAGAAAPSEAETPPSHAAVRVADTASADTHRDLQFVALKVPANRVAGTWPRLSYLESPLFIEDRNLCDSAESTFGIPSYSAWDSPYRSRRGRSAYATRQRIDCDEDGPHWYSRSDHRHVCDDDPLDGPTLFSVHDRWRGRLRFYSPPYYDFYAFGKRRSDRRPPRRGYWSYGTPPWYLPGSPTNFR